MRQPTFPVVLAGGTAFLDLYATQPLLPLLARTFRATPLAVSLTVTASTIAVALAAPIVGQVADRVGRRRVIVGSALALAASTALAASSTTLAQLIAWRFIQGLFTPGVFAVTIAYIHEEWPASRAGRVTAAYVSGTVCGGFAGRMIAGVVAADANWEDAFLVLAIVNLAAALAVWAWLPRERHVRRTTHATERGRLFNLLTNRQLLATYAVGFCVLFSLVAMFTYVTFVLAAPPYRLTTAALGSLFIVYLVGAAITPVAGRQIDVRGHRFGLVLACAMSVAGALLTLAHPLVAIVAGLAVCSSGVFVAQAVASSHVATTAEHHRGLAVGLYATFYYAGGSLGAAVPALLWRLAGWPGCVMLVVVMQAGMLAVALLAWKKGAEPPLSHLPESGI